MLGVLLCSRLVCGQTARIRVFTALGLIIVVLSYVNVASARIDVMELFNQGKSQMEAGRHVEAVETFSKVLNNVEPDSRNAHTVLRYRAWTYFENGALADAWKDVNAVLRSSQAEGDIVAECLNLRAFIHSKKGRERKALQDFTRAIKVRHDNQSLRAKSFANRGITYINLGKPDQAISDLDQAIKLKHDFGFAYAGRGLAYLRSDMIERARKDSIRALRLNPNEQTKSMAKRILKELSIEASGPLSVTVNMNRHGQIFVPVRFSKRGKPHRFLLDTGATYSLITRNLMKEIGKETTITKVRQDIVTVADGTRHRVTRYRIESAFLGNLPLGTIEVHVFGSKGTRITNLLGTRSLENIDVHIDNKSKKVKITRRDAS
jgi:tetratricopeptide (TPR) repeat protein